jgi:hypothetical protein
LVCYRTTCKHQLTQIYILTIKQKHHYPTAASQIIKGETGSRLNAAVEMFYAFNPIAERIRGVVETIDPHYAKLQLELRAKLANTTPFAKLISQADLCIFEGREILFNKQSTKHVDSQDPPWGWAVLLALGTFTKGGELNVHPLNLKLRYLPGDLIMLRGRVLEHSVELWSGGQRISIPIFTHTASWEAVGLLPLLDGFQWKG